MISYRRIKVTPVYGRGSRIPLGCSNLQCVTLEGMICGMRLIKSNDEHDKGTLYATGGLAIRSSGFSTISPFLEGILMEHIKLICSLESRLTFFSICSIRVPSRNRDIIEKPVQLM